MKRDRLFFVLLGFFVCVVPLGLVAQEPWANPVGRSTNDRDADLQNALLRLQRFDDAIKICKQSIEESEKTSDECALWAIRLSRALSARSISSDEFDQKAIDEAQLPVTGLLSELPNHARHLFLREQELNVAADAARHAVVLLSVNPTNTELADAASVNLARVTSQLQELTQRVDEERVQHESKLVTPGHTAFRSDLLRLHQELSVQWVSLALLQTELFKPQSRDAISAASRAVAVADEALGQLQSDSRAAYEVKRLRCQAIFSAQQIDRAQQELIALARAVPKPIPLSMLALQIRIDIARDNLSQAEARLAKVTESGSNVDLELARLEWMLAGKDKNIGQQLAAIEKMFGAFARRRAEVVSLSRLEKTGTKTDPAVIAAQGRDWLRRGNAMRAGQFLSSAARAETTAQQALKLASESAAAFVAAKQKPQAAIVLSETAEKHKLFPQSAKALLQSASLWSQSTDPDAARKTEVVLRILLRDWPKSEMAAIGRKWLIGILESAKRLTEAAEVATFFHDDSSAGQPIPIRDLWVKAARNEATGAKTDVATRFQKSFQAYAGNSVAEQTARDAGAIVLDAYQLSNLPSPSGPDSKYTDALINYRLGKSRTLQTPPVGIAADVTWRLMRDGRQNASLQTLIARTIGAWDLPSDGSLEAIERSLWLERLPDAKRLADQQIAASKSPGTTLKQIARMLGRQKSIAAQKLSIAYWDKLAKGIPKGSDGWYEAKLAAIELLLKTSQRDEAIKRAKYILLTSPPKDAKWLARFQELGK